MDPETKAALRQLERRKVPVTTVAGAMRPYRVDVEQLDDPGKVLFQYLASRLRVYPDQRSVPEWKDLVRFLIYLYPLDLAGELLDYVEAEWAWYDTAKDSQQ